MYFTVSYGLSREQLEEVNFLIRNSDPVNFASWVGHKLSELQMFNLRVHKDNNQSTLPFTFTMYKGLRPPPSSVLRTPLLAELFGAGFTKAPASNVCLICQTIEIFWPKCCHFLALRASFSAFEQSISIK